MTLTPRPHQVAGAEFLAARAAALLAWDCRVGKEQPVDVNIMTPNGPMKMGLIAVGDYISHPTLGVTKVIGVYPQGVKQSYRVTFSDGSSTECGIDHLWAVDDKNNRRRVMSLKRIISTGLRQVNRVPQHRIPDYGPVAFHGPKKLPLDPYVLGVLIGDGCLVGNRADISISDRDIDIKDRVEAVLGRALKGNRTGPSCCSYYCNELRGVVASLCLDVKSADKFIPHMYKIASIEDRIELLRGLMGTDGTCGKNGDSAPRGYVRRAGTTSFSTKSEQLMRDVTWLVRSLGCRASAKSYVRKRTGELEFVVMMQLNFNPFYTKFKSDRWKPVSTKGRRARFIKSIEYARKVEQQCIKVDAPDGLYLTDDFIVTHNTGAALLACNLIGARRVNIVTTKSGESVWLRAINQWGLEAPDWAVRAWSSKAMWRLGEEPCDVLIGDECHKASNPGAQRTKDFYGELGPDGLYRKHKSAIAQAKRVWLLSATPAPHDNSNLYPMLRALHSLRLGPHLAYSTDRSLDWPEVRTWKQFRDRYCVLGKKKLPNGQKIDIVIKSKNSDELGRRMEGFYHKLTQKDVGIIEPTYDLLPLAVDPKDIQDMETGLPLRAILEAAAAGDTDSLDMQLGPLMRLTATHKARLVADIVRDEFEGGEDKIVLAYWHRDVGDILEQELHEFGALRLDGSTTAKARGWLEEVWHDETPKVFLAQMEAGSEAIDLSASANLIFVEMVFRPATMRQMALRITNFDQPKTPLVRVSVLQNSIEEKVQERLLGLWTSMKGILV